MKKVLVVYYSQTGQQKDIVDSIVAPIREDNQVDVEYYQIKPKKDYEFPWNKKNFFDVFPETFLQISTDLDLDCEQIIRSKYDLIILSYQVWFLSPSLPIISFLKSKEAKQIFDNKKVITVIGCRNMWAMAQEKIKKQLIVLNSKLVGNIVFTDRQSNHVSLVTLLYWLFQGKKDSYLGIFPKPGVPDKDIEEATKFGKPILTCLKKDNYEELQQNLLDLKAVIVKPLLVFIEKRATFIFFKWAKVIVKKGRPGEESRNPWLKALYIYLMIGLWILMPIVSILFNLIYLPFFFLFKKTNNYYKSVT